jgi:hypothetical protein
MRLIEMMMKRPTNIPEPDLIYRKLEQIRGRSDVEDDQVLSWAMEWIEWLTVVEGEYGLVPESNEEE